MSTFDDMVEFLDATWCMRKEIVPCLVGPVGIGKTMAVERHCRNVGAKRVVKIVASQILPNEVSGITMPDAEAKAMEIYDHFRLSSMEDGDILFFDELLEADQMVLSACLTLLESRELMSGRKLPDIQIVAATNPTVKPASLKANIKQRFLFRHFKIDRKGCRRYISDEYGIDVGYLVDKIVDDDPDKYNILSQRSLTKMAKWIASVPSDERERVAEQINAIWMNDLGTKLLARVNKESAEDKVRSTVQKLVAEEAKSRNMSVEDYIDTSGCTVGSMFKEATFDELLEVLSKLPDWDKISEKLSEIEVQDDGPGLDDVKF